MKWGIIATGTIADKFAGTIGKMCSEGQSLAAVGSRNEEKAGEFAAKPGIARYYGSYEGVWSDPDVDAVYIGTPNNLHYENCLACLENGKHVLCEKPLTCEGKQARQLYDLAASKGLLLLEGLWIRFLPVYDRLRDILTNGEIGEIVNVKADYGFIARGARRERKFRSELGGGALYDIGIYTIGFIQMVMGQQPVSFSSQVQMNEFGTDSDSTLRLKYASGTEAECRQVIGEEIERNAVITGTKGNVFLEDFQMAEEMEITGADGTVRKVSVPFEINGFEYEIRAFTEGTGQQKTSLEPYTPGESIANMELLEKIRQSWQMEF